MKGILYCLALIIAIILLLEGCSISYKSTDKIELPSVFSENMVLQAGKEIAIWGRIDPNAEIKVWIEDNNASAVSDSTGKFQLSLDEMDYGGPYTLYLAGSDTVELNNIMIGEVWVCSGQSNMQWQVGQSENAEAEIKSADYRNIRLFTVPRKVSTEPMDDCEGEWITCSPENIRSFSAVGYFFGRELYKNLDKPIGLIHSSWGGTPIESWMELNTLKNDSDFVPIVKRYENNIEEYPEKMKEYNRLVAKIESEGLKLPSYQTDNSNKGLKKGWSKKNFDDSDWGDVKLPGFVESIVKKKIDGAFWFRKDIELPSEFLNRDLTIELGAIDDFDITYFNGIQIGSIDKNTPNFWSTPRKYDIKGNYVAETLNVISVRIFDHFGEGGFSGTPSQMKIYPKDDPSEFIKISGTWKFKIETALDPNNVTGPGGGKLPPAPLGPGHPHTPSGLYNAMIVPLAPFTIQGFIWYQGEANASRAFQYRKLLPSLIQNWRNLWDDNRLYFGIVQLANFMAEMDQPTESAWAELREAQYLTSLNDPRTGLAVTIDIGEADDIHPKNKQDVGKRLAYWALNICYNKTDFNDGTDIYSGPVFQEMTIYNGKAHLTFSNCGDGLTTNGHESVKGFAIAGKNRKFEWADAMIEGNKIIVWNDNILEPAAVRYAWANNPVCNLYNSVGLPASPFRTDDWPGVTKNER